MFKNLTNLEYQRTAKEALGFYIAYNGFFIGLFILVGFLIPKFLTMYLVMHPSGFEFLFKVGRILAIITCLLLSLLIAKRKNLTKEFYIKIVIIASMIFAFINGTLLGLVPAAYLSALPPATKKSKKLTKKN